MTLTCYSSWQRAARAVVCFILPAGLFSSAQGGLEPVASEAFRHFQEAAPSGLSDYLRTRRPGVLEAEAREKLLALLPTEGEVHPAAKDKPKLSAVDAVLHYFDRKVVVEIKVIRVFQAHVGFYARSAILISEPALQMLETGELQALVAHELGHEYFWSEYEQAREQSKTRRMQELELRCDALAVAALADLGLDPSLLISAIGKMHRFNARFGTPLNAASYVSDRQRTHFIEAIADQVRRRLGNAAPK